MKKLLIKLGFVKEEMTLDEYIISIRPTKRELSQTSVTVTYVDLEIAALRRKNGDIGPEEAGCLVLT